MSKHAAPVPSTCEWRRLGPHLWAGASEHGPVGTIEHGRRFKAVDPDGTVVGRCHDLAEAQALLEHVLLARRLATAA